jgi:hypothetical protein
MSPAGSSTTPGTPSSPPGLDQAGLGGVLHMLERIGADLLGVRRAP